MRRPNIIPNLPDVVLRKIFGMLSYKELCAAEAVCRRWQNIMLTQMRREIHELIIERLGSWHPSAHHIKGFKRLALHCPSDSFDFLSGVLRRHRLQVSRLTADITFLASIEQLHVNKDATRKYFSNVEDLWLLIVACPDEMTERFMRIEHNLFSDLNQLTLQVHVMQQYVENVGTVVSSFLRRYPKTNISLELHADNSKLIFDQLRHLPSLPLNKIKIICTEFDMPQLRIDHFYEMMLERKILAKNITLRDWSLFTDGSTPISPLPLETFRISCCTVETVDNLVVSLRLTAAQERPKPKKKVIKRKKPIDGVIDDGPKKKVVKKVVKKKKSPFIQKLEIAGQCTLHGLQFLEDKAHTELEKRLGTAIPEMEVDCSEIYYCF